MAPKTMYGRVGATLNVHFPPSGDSAQPGGLKKRIKLQFNPNSLDLSGSSTWKYTPTPAERAGGKQEFTGPNPRSLSLEIFLDCSDEPGSGDVREAVDALFQCLEVEPSSRPLRSSPPWVRFEWGTFRTVGFVAYMRDVSASYTLFASNGEPIRATCRLSLEEIPQQTPGQNPTSGALTARRVHRVVAGDSLLALAWREYGDATAWRPIAELNGIDDPMRLRPGRELLLPAPEEIDA
jgi:hypothetical protein